MTITLKAASRESGPVLLLLLLSHSGLIAARHRETRVESERDSFLHRVKHAKTRRDLLWRFLPETKFASSEALVNSNQGESVRKFRRSPVFSSSSCVRDGSNNMVRSLKPSSGVLCSPLLVRERAQVSTMNSCGGRGHVAVVVDFGVPPQVAGEGALRFPHSPQSREDRIAPVIEFFHSTGAPTTTTDIHTYYAHSRSRSSMLPKFPPAR